MFAFYVILSILISGSSQADTFNKDAPILVKELKSSLMSELSSKIANKGPAEAVSFCHFNVGKIAQTAAKDYLAKYEFGRTSHKIRNSQNKPQEWLISYLEDYQGSFKNDKKKESIIFRLKNSKRVYLEPLYSEAKCLLCHGSNINKNIQSKLSQMYPDDQAIGFKLGEFRGFIWVKEK